MAKSTSIKSPMAIPEKQVKLPLIDNPSAPDLYADDAIGFLLTNNTLRITLATVRTDHTKNPNVNNCAVTGRLVLPIQAAQNLHTMLGTVLEKLKPQQAGETTRNAKTLQ
jgi:hypothetical protein